MKQYTLAAFSAERRMAAVVLFRGIVLENTFVTNVPYDPDQVPARIRALVLGALEAHRPEFLAISVPSAKAGSRVNSFCAIAKEVATAAGVIVVEVDDRTLMSAYGTPSLKRKEHVRRVGRVIWPSLDDARAKRAAVDAATVGLYLQTERLFSLSEEET